MINDPPFAGTPSPHSCWGRVTGRVVIRNIRINIDQRWRWQRFDQLDVVLLLSEPADGLSKFEIGAGVEGVPVFNFFGAPEVEAVMANCEEGGEGEEDDEEW